MSSGRQRLFLNGVSVVLSGDAETFRGASIAWATKVERDHAMVSLPGHAAVTECIRNAAEFTINVLAAEQSHIARQYGDHRKRTRWRFNGATWISSCGTFRL